VASWAFVQAKQRRPKISSDLGRGHPNLIIRRIFWLGHPYRPQRRPTPWRAAARSRPKAIRLGCLAGGYLFKKPKFVDTSESDRKSVAGWKPSVSSKR